MRALRRALLSSTLAILALTLAGAGATASTVSISPGGNFTAASSGAVTFSTGGINITCNVTLAGSLKTSATGTLTASPDPAQNPNIGAITGGSVSGCSGGSVALLFGTPGQIYNNAIDGSGLPTIGLSELRFLLSVAGVGSCLYRRIERYIWNIFTWRWLLISEINNSLVTLSGVCPTSLTIQSTFAISSSQTVTLT
jgi:hypothetical protein